MLLIINKQNSDITWQRYKLNLRNPLLLEEYFLVMEQFDSTLSSVIDSTLGLRCRSFGYRYSEIIRSLMSKGMLWAEVVYSSLYLSDNSVMRGRVHAIRTLKGLVADLRGKIYNDIFVCFMYIFIHWCFISTSMLKSLRALSHTFKNETRIALMQRILSFHGFFDLNRIFLRLSARDFSYRE